MKNVKRIYLASLLATATLINPYNSFAGICKSVIDQFYFAEESQVKSHFFDKYLIDKKQGVYYIHATKTTMISFFRLVEVLQDIDSYPSFMLGYKAIKTRQVTNSELLTSILFDPPLSPFTSRFTNEVEIISDFNNYQQCWRQLPQDDSRVEEKYRNAPIINKGYWQLENLGKSGTKISYYGAIKPPILLPLIVYRFLVQNSYEESFNRILKKADQVE